MEVNIEQDVWNECQFCRIEHAINVIATINYT